MKSVDSVGRTKLHWAVACNMLSEIKLLAGDSRAINQVCTNGASPLYIAAQMGHLEAVQDLLRAGAQIDKARTNNDRATPLCIAARQGHLKVAQALITAGANLEQARTDNGSTPLYAAAQGGHLEVVQV